MNNVQLANQKVQETIIQAKRYKAVIKNKQPGMEFASIESVNNQVNRQYTDNVDDEFFHLTCHVDLQMKLKIEQGAYVDLKKLLYKDRCRKPKIKLELIQQDGTTFFTPAESSNKINSVKRWEQAFWVYAAIYSAANPQDLQKYGNMFM